MLENRIHSSYSCLINIINEYYIHHFLCEYLTRHSLVSQGLHTEYVNNKTK